MHFEVWEGRTDNGCWESSLIAEADDQVREMAAKEPHLKVTRTFEADTRDEGMRLYHQHMGWEPYIPFDELSGPYFEVRGTRAIPSDDEQ